jgi:pimeloyl-ACP methyl ester carboxylesterase
VEGVLITSSDPRLTSQLLTCGQRDAPLLLCIHGGGCNSGYFNIRGFSVARAAMASGFDVLLVNRPGHGGSAPPRTAHPIDEAADLLPRHLAPIMAPRASRDLVVIGHSIGGAVALTLAAEARLAIRSVAVSGIGRKPSDAARVWLAAKANLKGPNLDPPSEFFFGPEGSYDWRGPIALRKVVETWRPDELQDVRTDWPRRFDAVAGLIDVPVAFHLAEHERIWRAGAQDVADAAARFTRAPHVKSGVLPDGGHLYEIHKRGAELVALQLAFLKSSCQG